MQCTVTMYVGDILVICNDEATIAGVIEALKPKYHDVQEHMGVKHSYLRMSLYMSVAGVWFVADMLKDVGLGSVITPASGVLFMISKSSLLFDEARRKRFHS